MALDQETPAAGLADVVESDDPQILRRIHEPRTALAIWRRAPSAALLAGLDAAAPELLPDARFVAPRATVAAATEAACARLPEPSLRAMLAADASALAAWFAELMTAARLRIRLQTIETDACRLFHRDSVPARLLCTYRGPATEWGYAEDGATPDEIRSLRRGDAALLKGSRWPNAPASRLVHRSPPIVETGETRLLLVVDPVEE